MLVLVLLLVFGAGFGAGFGVGFGAGFVSAGFTSAGFGAGVSNCEANLVNFASNSAILSSRFFFCLF